MANKTVTITAKFDGICDYCDQPTEKGALISKHNNRWVHPECIAKREQDEAAVLAEIRRYDPKFKGNATYDEMVPDLEWLQREAARLGETPEQFAAHWSAE